MKKRAIAIMAITATLCGCGGASSTQSDAGSIAMDIQQKHDDIKPEENLPDAKASQQDTQQVDEFIPPQLPIDKLNI